MTAAPGPASDDAPELEPGTPVLLIPTQMFPKPQAGVVRAWPADAPAEQRRTRIPIWVYGDKTPYVAWPHTVVAL